MRKVLLCIALTTIVLSGCNKNETTKETAESTKESTIVSSTRKEVELKVYYPEYNIEKNTYKISGKVDEKKKVTASINGGQKNDVKITASGSIDYSGTIPETDTDILFSDGEKEITITVKSLATLEKEKIEKQAELDKKKQEEKKESETTISENSEEIDTTNSLLDYQKEGMKNADMYPAAPGSILFDKKERKFQGMNYYFDGEIIGEVKLNNVTDGKAWLVKNSNGYVLPVEHSYFEASNGDKVKIWGTLSGLQFSNTDLGVDNVVGATGSMHALSVERNGETLY